MQQLCNWNNPGVQRLTAPIPFTILHKHTDIPLWNRLQIAAKSAVHAYDEQITITKYQPQIQNMTFGKGQMCGMVSRAAWDNNYTTGALIYKSGNYSVGVAAICGNTFEIPAPVPVPYPGVVPYPGPGYGSGSGPAKTNYVPEPDSFGLLCLGLLIIYFRRNKK